MHVNYFPSARRRHITAVLSADRTIAPYAILSCHGEDGRILLPELAPEIARFQPFEHLGPDDVRSHLHLDGSTVIATGCDTRHPALAEAVLDAGAAAYIAPTGAPFGYASMFAPVFLFYELTELRSLPGRRQEAAGSRQRASDVAPVHPLNS